MKIKSRAGRKESQHIDLILPQTLSCLSPSPQRRFYKECCCLFLPLSCKPLRRGSCLHPGIIFPPVHQDCELPWTTFCHYFRLLCSDFWERWPLSWVWRPDGLSLPIFPVSLLLQVTPLRLILGSPPPAPSSSSFSSSLFLFSPLTFSALWGCILGSLLPSPGDLTLIHG